MAVRNTNTICCGTCQYWTGAREPVFDKNGTPKISIPKDAVGDCECSQSRFFEQPRHEKRSCQCFSKWTEIL